MRAINHRLLLVVMMAMVGMLLVALLTRSFTFVAGVILLTCYGSIVYAVHRMVARKETTEASLFMWANLGLSAGVTIYIIYLIWHGEHTNGLLALIALVLLMIESSIRAWKT